jgi:hypothetical protein
MVGAILRSGKKQKQNFGQKTNKAKEIRGRAEKKSG